jgi:hypothetical protein
MFLLCTELELDSFPWILSSLELVRFLNNRRATRSFNVPEKAEAKISNDLSLLPRAIPFLSRSPKKEPNV